MSDDDDFRGHEDMRVPLPEQGVDKILIPQLFIKKYAHPTGQFQRDANGKFITQRVPHKNRTTGAITYTNEKIPITRPAWKISKISDNKSINKTRQISSRKKKPVLDLKTAKVEKVQEEHHYIPRLADFPNLEDRRMIFEYLTHLAPDEINSFPENKTRGRPPILFKNWDYHDYGDLPPHYKENKIVSHEDIFGSDSESDEEKPKPKKKARQPIPISQLESESDSDEEKPPTPKPKPKKKARQPIPISQLESESDSEEEEKPPTPKPEKPKPKSVERQKKTEPIKEVEREESIAMKVVPPRHYPEIENLYKDYKLKKVYEVDNLHSTMQNYIGKPNEKIIFKSKQPTNYTMVNHLSFGYRKLPNQQLWGLTMTYRPDYHTEVIATLEYFPSIDKAKEAKHQLEERFKKIIDFEKINGEFKIQSLEKIKKALKEDPSYKPKEPKKPQTEEERMKEVEREDIIEQNIIKKLVPPRKYLEIENLYKDFKLHREIQENRGDFRSIDIKHYIGNPHEKTIKKSKYPQSIEKINKFYLGVKKSANQLFWDLNMSYVPDYHTQVFATLDRFPTKDKAEEAKNQLEKIFKKEIKFESNTGAFIKNAKKSVFEALRKALAEEKEKSAGGGGGAGGGYVSKGSGVDPCWKRYEMIGMKKKKGKKVPNCVPKGGELPDFENIKWGTFKSLYNRFLKKNPDFKDKIEDLEHFAHFVISNPDKFSKVAEKKARFYVNLIEKK